MARTWRERGIPNPGSDEAIEQGCICPVLDNAHGREECTLGLWWIRVGCPLHGMEEEAPDADTCVVAEVEARAWLAGGEDDT